jgi:hypothetical protein
VPLPRAPYTIALVVILALSAVPAHAQSDWKVFTHPTMGFSVSYPPGWVPRIATDARLHLVMIGPSAARVPAFEMAAFVISIPARPNATIEEMYDGTNSPLEEQVGKSRIMRVDRTKLNGIPAAVFYETSFTRGTDIYVMVLLTIAKSRAYAVAGITALDSTQLAAETRQLQAILASFRPGAGSLNENAVAPPGPGLGIDSVHN